MKLRNKGLGADHAEDKRHSLRRNRVGRVVVEAEQHREEAPSHPAIGPSSQAADEGAPKVDGGAESGVPTASGAMSGWRMGLVVTASAFCGGIAVVLWNRRLLSKIREIAPVARSAQQGRLWEDDF